MPDRRPSHIVVAGASEGGIDALTALVGGLPSNFPGAVLVVLHVSPGFRSMLPEILTKGGPLPAHYPRDGEDLRPGEIYVAPPDRHLLVDRRKAWIIFGPKENFSRPAVDPLFRSAAEFWGPRAAGIVLSGNLSDGTAGLWSMQRRGALTIVQDLAEAKIAGMPRSALAHVKPDHQLPAARMGPVLAAWVAEGRRREAVEPDHGLAFEDAAIRNVPVGPAAMQTFGKLTPYVCPECGGPLWAARSGPPRMRCHTGHAFTAADLISSYGQQQERMLWSSVRVMEEQAQLIQDEAGQKKLPREQRKELEMAARRSRDCAAAVRRLLNEFKPYLPASG